jgi:hypothetical protein
VSTIDFRGKPADSTQLGVHLIIPPILGKSLIGTLNTAARISSTSAPMLLISTHLPTSQLLIWCLQNTATESLGLILEIMLITSSKPFCRFAPLEIIIVLTVSGLKMVYFASLILLLH